jgi:hypothetical protein
MLPHVSFVQSAAVLLTLGALLRGFVISIHFIFLLLYSNSGFNVT